MDIERPRVHIVCCWEIGSGLGHIYQLVVIINALKTRGFRVSAIVKESRIADDLMKHEGIEWYQAPSPSSIVNSIVPVNHADILHCNGYDCALNLQSMVEKWWAVFSELSPTYIITESAPTASLVASRMGIQSLNIDNGFFTPPLASPMPSLREWEPIADKVLKQREDRTLKIINEVARVLGFNPLKQIHELFNPKTYWLTWPEISHYKHARTDRFLGPVFAEDKHIAPNLDKRKEKIILAYLKGDHPFSVSTLIWCLRQNKMVAAYLPNWSANQLQLFNGCARLKIFNRPINLDELLPETAFVVCHGGAGTVCKSLAYGVAPIVVASHVEQYRTYRSLLKSGLTARIFSSNGSFDVDPIEFFQAKKNVLKFSQRHAGAAGMESLMKLVEQDMSVQGLQ